MSQMLPEIITGNIITTRVRLARNLAGYPFRIKDESVARDVIKKVNRALVKCDTFNLFYISNLSDLTTEAMKERHLLSRNLIDNVECGAALINKDESLSIMINEEDVIREQCFMDGLRLKEAYKRLSLIDDELNKNLNLAFDERFGYLTACPTNLGTGLRASVMMFLPTLTESGKIRDVVRNASAAGLTVRGLYGEGSSAEGCIYQISNEVTLGVGEYEVLRTVEDAVLSVCAAEREETERRLKTDQLKITDRAKKSYGILTNAVTLSYKEFSDCMVNVKLGAMLGMINIAEISALDKLTEAVRPANLCERYGKKLSEIDRELLRAEVVGKKLIKLREE